MRGGEQAAASAAAPRCGPGAGLAVPEVRGPLGRWEDRARLALHEGRGRSSEQGEGVGRGRRQRGCGGRVPGAAVRGGPGIEGV